MARPASPCAGSILEEPRNRFLGSARPRVHPFACARGSGGSGRDSCRPSMIARDCVRTRRSICRAGTVLGEGRARCSGCAGHEVDGDLAEGDTVESQRDPHPAGCARAPVVTQTHALFPGRPDRAGAGAELDAIGAPEMSASSAMVCGVARAASVLLHVRAPAFEVLRQIFDLYLRELRKKAFLGIAHRGGKLRVHRLLDQAF